MIKLILLGVIFFSAEVCFAAPGSAGITGVVEDANGKPLAHAMVMVYHAGVKTGYSTFCPSCYADCGKRAVTDASGSFKIQGVAPDLLFKLLAAHEGYTPAFTEHVDPLNKDTVTITLAARPKTKDFSGIVRGRVVDADGSPLHDAVIETRGAMVALPGMREKVGVVGEVPGLDPIAVSNDRGDFEVASANPADKIWLSVEARAMAPKFVIMQTGVVRQPVVLAQGEAISGRLMMNGKPVGNAEVGLIPKNRARESGDFRILGDPYDEIRIGTKRDGSFLITNVPSSVDWYMYPKMSSVAQEGAMIPIEVKTTPDQELVHLGDLTLKPGYRVNGQVLLNDGKAVPEGTRVVITSKLARDSLTTVTGAVGAFAFANLPAGEYTVFASLKGYEVQRADAHPYDDVLVSVDRDVDGVTVTMQAAKARAQ